VGFPTWADLLWSAGALAYVVGFVTALAVVWATSRVRSRTFPWSGIAAALVCGLAASAAAFLVVGSVVYPAVGSP
jgi:hypothetical protein